MAGPGSPRLVRAALRCYPRRWRGRHGEEAFELAGLLIRDGTAARSIAWSYFRGAAVAWLAPPSRRLGASVGALLVAACSLGISLALVSSSAPASAASAHRAHGTSPGGTAGQPWSPPHCTRVPGSGESVSWHGQRC